MTQIDVGTPLLAGYLDRAQLAEELGRSTRTLLRWVRQGDGPPMVRIGGRILFRREAVARWLRLHEQRPARPNRKRA
jgi:excisionase family DNA binding protein